MVLLAKTFAIGLAVAMPVGAMGCLCIERTLSHGWRRGITTGAGIATADAIYAAVAAFGVTAVTSVLVSSQTALRLVGGAALLAIGVRNLFAAPGDGCTAESRPGGLWAQYGGAVALTLTNPMTIIAFGGILMGAGLLAGDAKEAAIAVLGVAAGSFAWWLVLVSIVAAVRHGFTQRHLDAVGRVSGLVIAAFGVLAIIAAFR